MASCLSAAQRRKKEMKRGNCIVGVRHGGERSARTSNPRTGKGALEIRWKSPKVPETAHSGSGSYLKDWREENRPNGTSQ